MIFDHTEDRLPLSEGFMAAYGTALRGWRRRISRNARRKWVIRLRDEMYNTIDELDEWLGEHPGEEEPMEEPDHPFEAYDANPTICRHCGAVKPGACYKIKTKKDED